MFTEQKGQHADIGGKVPDMCYMGWSSGKDAAGDLLFFWWSVYNTLIPTQVQWGGPAGSGLFQRDMPFSGETLRMIFKHNLYRLLMEAEFN